MIFTQLVQANLSTKILGRKIEYYQILESTNSEAWKLVEDSTQHGTIVITDNQTAGKGRGSNEWASSPDRNLTFSVILIPGHGMNPLLIPLAAGVAVAEALNLFDIKAGLKWPNDILRNGKKLGGILCESKVQGASVSAVVLGIGLNVNEDKSDFPEALTENATSMFIESGSRFQRERVLAECLNSLENCFLEPDETAIRNWTELCCHIGKQISFSSGGETVTGIFTRLDASGTAVVEVNGEQKTFFSPVITIED